MADEAVRLFEERTGHTLNVVTWSQRTDLYPSIWLGTFSRFGPLTAVLDSAELGGLGASVRGEEYQILVQDGRVLIGGSDLRALRWGVQSLTQLISEMMGQLFVDRVYIRDWPDMKKRTAEIGSPMRTAEQATYVHFNTDCAYLVRINEIVFNDGDAGNRQRTTYSIEQALQLRNKLRAYGMALSIGVDKIGNYVSDRSWQEGIPIRGTLMQVGNPTFAVIPAGYGSSFVANSGFESWSGNRPNDWTMYREDRWAYVSRDNSIKKSGTSSVRFSNFTNAPSDPDLRQPVYFGSHRAFRVTFWYRMSGFVGTLQCGDYGLAVPYNRSARWQRSCGTPTSCNWTQVEVLFCTFHLDSTMLMIGPRSPSAGTLWIDDIQVTALEPMDVLRRPDTPLRVYDRQSGLLLSEGVDYRVVETGETTNERFVELPRFERLSGGRLSTGDTVRVEWAWAHLYQGYRQTVCFSQIEPLLEYQDRIAIVDSMFRPDGYKININELALANYDDACTQRHLTPGQLVGSYLRQMFQIIQARHPGVPVRTYGDATDAFVFDPRAMPVTYSPWTLGVIEELPDEMEIMAMADYTSNLDSSLTFFSNGNQRTVLGIHLGMSSGLPNWFAWFQTAKRYPMCDGVNTYHWLSDQAVIAQRMSEIGNMAWNSGPYVIHGPETYSSRPDSVVIRAEAWSDNFIGTSSATITSCRLSYRLLPNGNWSVQSMAAAGTDSYSAAVRSLGQDATGIEYYITIQDSRNLEATAPADAPSRTFLTMLPIEAGTQEQMNYEQVPFRVYGAFGNTVIEWNNRSDARWFEVHFGDNPDFRANSPTLVSRLTRESPRFILSAQEERTGIAQMLRVYAILSPDDRREWKNQSSRK